MVINDRAPVRAEAEGTVEAPAAVVWDTLADLASWPRWIPDVRSMEIEGDLAQGVPFRWRAGSLTIASTLLHVDRPAELAWRGRVIGIRAIHWWWFEPREGATHVRTAESWDGLIPSLLRWLLRPMLRRTLARTIAALKQEAELRAGSGS